MTRLAFLGSPAVSAACLRALHGAGHDIRLVVTEADKRRSRGGAPVPTPVKAAALELGLPTSDRLSAILEVDAELGVVVAFGRLIKPPVLGHLPLVNVHFSLLPRWRGAAPVEWAILAGDEKTGVCLMEVEAGLDTGGVYARRAIPIGEGERAEELRERLGSLGASLLVDRLGEGAGGLGVPVPQSELGGEVSYAPKLSSKDLRLDFSRPAASLARVARVGRAWTTFSGARLLVHEARAEPGAVAGEPGTLVEDGGALKVATGEGLLLLGEVQQEGRRRQRFEDWARGARLRAGERLGGRATVE